MIDPKTNQNRENSGFWTLSKFGGLDQLDWLMIVVSVLIGTIAKQHHFLQLPGRVPRMGPSVPPDDGWLQGARLDYRE